MSQRTFFPQRIGKLPLTLALAASSMILTTGCANMATTAGAGNAFVEPGSLGGIVHGGNQPIGGATVDLWTVGTTGYGSKGTKLATTTTAKDGTGSFNFNKSGTSIGNYTCPSANTLLYVVASGGNTLNDYSKTYNNTAAVMVAAVGQCGTAGSQFIDLNEVSSVATIFALAQYMNPGATTGAGSTVSIGTASDYTVSIPSQSGIGLINAFNSVATLATIGNGTANATVTPKSSVAGITITATPESAKINTIADILASCVNNADNTAQTCTNLFTAAVPPPAAVTSQPSATFPTAGDTLQAAYYMAVNPSNSNSTSNAATLYALVTGSGAPFQPTVTAQPLDWTISVSYTSSGTCTSSNTAGFLASPETVAVDASGNVWMLNGATGATNALVQFGPTGTAQLCVAGNITTGRGLTIDTKGNVWAAGAVAGTGILEYLANGSTLSWPTTYAAGGIVADGSGNIFYAQNTGAGTVQEFPGAATATVAASAATSVGSSLPSAAYLYMAVDHLGNVLVPNPSSGSSIYDLAPTTYASTDLGSASLLLNGYGAAVDRSGYLIGASTCCSNVVSNTIFKAAPTGSGLTSTVSGKYAGGLVGPRSSAVDGANNYWFGMGYPTVPVSSTNTSTTFALAETDSSFNSLSPGGSVPATCSSTNTNCYTNGGFQKSSLATVRSLAIDPSGNVWAASSNGNMVELVGAAVPVVTPLSAAAAAGTYGTKP
ncbi:hypothetical protein SAMN05421770_102183 [Granulicella rosea]|uniref:NHL repeat containing protein n=1 Tax=Granulicella rosea TaxID=474952 RepID=A0A239H2G7_9BACT|nr:hypothetical protein [Granulicella rosea]SNS75228.1 hypothetical protein SAMN05421770_102183 [Granulicella rosea]